MLTKRPLRNSVVRLAAAFAILFVAPAPAARATALARDGAMPQAVREALDAGILAVPDPRANAAGVAQTEWRVPIVMIAFTDRPLTYGAADFEPALFDTTGANPQGSAAEYWRWASGGRVRLSGRVVATVTLPNDVAYYGSNYYGLHTTFTPHNIYGAIRDALTACEASVDWSEFDNDHDGYVDMMWILHAGMGGEAGYDVNSMWSITSRLTGGWAYGTPFVTSDPVPDSPTQTMRIDRFSTLPELTPWDLGAHSEIGVYCHEFGHALGLPDLYDTSSLGGTGNNGPGNWSLMSTGLRGADGGHPARPAHPSAWAMKALGWVTTVRPTRDTTITLQPIETGGPVLEVWFEGESSTEHFLIENRQRLGFDEYLLSEGLLVYHLDQALIDARWATNRINTGPTPGLKLVEADGNDDIYRGINRGDWRDPFPGSLGVTRLDESSWPNTATFTGATTGLSISDIAFDGDNMRFTLSVEAPGWQPAHDRTEPGYTPVEVYSPARAAAVDAGGTISVVSSELRPGGPEVVLRTRRDGGWAPGEVISASPGSALNPSLALLPGGDLAVAWSDTRAGVSRIFYRTRVGGAWTLERPLAQLPGDAYRPAIAADAQGTVYAAWLQVIGQRLAVMFMRFPYTSPFGSPSALTDSTQTPDDPSVTVSPGGSAYVMWADRVSYPKMLWFARFSEDSGLSARQQLIPPPTQDPGAYTGVADAAGRLHAVWFQSQGSISSIHYQRRDFTTPTWLPDTVIEVRNETLQSPILEVDGQGTLHLAYESLGSGTQQVRYKHWRSAFGWDARSTSVTRAGDGVGYRPMVLPRSSGRVTVLYSSYVGSAPGFFERDRTLDPPPLTAVPPEPAPASMGLVAAPNPVRPGVAFALRWSGDGSEAPAEVEVFDVAGRRVARAPLLPVPGGRVARFEPARTDGWSAGLYFARTPDGRATTRLVVLR